MAELIPILPSELEELPEVRGTETVVTFNEQEVYNRTTIAKVAEYFRETLKTRLEEIEGKIITEVATSLVKGLMSSADKTKLDGLIASLATTTSAGYMSPSDKTKLDGIDAAIANAADILGGGYKLCIVRFLVNFYGTQTTGQQYADVIIQSTTKENLISSVSASAGGGSAFMRTYITVNLNSSIGTTSGKPLIATPSYCELQNGDSYPLISSNFGEAGGSQLSFNIEIMITNSNTIKRSVGVSVLIPYIPSI